MVDDRASAYTGRIFKYEKSHCYDLARDWFLNELGIALPDFDRGEDEWWIKGENRFVDYFPQAGFYQTNETPRRGNLLLMRIMSPVTNHCAVYVGNNYILHHLYGRLSCRDIYGSFFRRSTTHILRHHEA